MIACFGLQYGQTANNGFVTVQFDRGSCRHEWLFGAGLEHVVGIRMVQRDFLSFDPESFHAAGESRLTLLAPRRPVNQLACAMLNIRITLSSLNMPNSSDRNTPWARYEIEVYELHVGTYQIDARSTADAIKRLFDGDGDLLNGSEYIGLCEEKGLPVDENSQLAQELRQLGVPLDASVIPSIRNIRQKPTTEESG